MLPPHNVVVLQASEQSPQAQGLKIFFLMRSACLKTVSQYRRSPDIYQRLNIFFMLLALQTCRGTI
jgi:hypothetical protein